MSEIISILDAGGNVGIIAIACLFWRHEIRLNLNERRIERLEDKAA